MTTPYDMIRAIRQQAERLVVKPGLAGLQRAFLSLLSFFVALARELETVAHTQARHEGFVDENSDTDPGGSGNGPGSGNGTPQ